MPDSIAGKFRPRPARSSRLGAALGIGTSAQLVDGVVGVAGASWAGLVAFLATFFPATLRGTAFFAAGAFAAIFFAEDVAAGATAAVAVFAARATFFAADLDLVKPFATAFFAAFFTVFVAAGSVTATAGALPIRNCSRLLAEAIHAGARPKPVQVFPVLGSWYFAVPAPVLFARVFFEAEGLPRTAIFAERAALETCAPRCSIVTPSDSINDFTFATDAFISTSVRRAAFASRAEICFLISVTVSFAMVFEGRIGGT